MDPFSIKIIKVAVGEMSGKLVEKAWDFGKKWLANYFKDHHPKAKEKARENALKFLENLAQRVHQLEEEIKDNERIKQQIENALTDPDFSALLKDALITSSRTSNEEKRKILARIVSERLRCQSEGLVALTSTLACEAVKHLTSKQMRFLGATAFVYVLRPNQTPTEISPVQFSQWYINWLSNFLSLHLPIESLTQLDFLHLESVSCLKYEPFINRDLKKILTPSTKSIDDWSFQDFVQNNPVGKQLYSLWQNGMQQTTLTTTGQLIGIYVHDELTKTRTIINW